MTIIRTPEVGMFISGSMAAVGLYAAFKMLQERWRRRRNWRSDEAYRASWNKQRLPLVAWLTCSLVVLAMNIHDYCNQMMHGP
jgi:hypothetical protein